MSKYEEKIASILRQSRIPFEREKTFVDLNHGRFRFDFCVHLQSGQPLLLECDGEQHFHFVRRFYKNRKQFTKQLENDRRKNSYCLAHSIPLYRIPYWEISSLSTVADLFKPAFCVRSRWHNDYLIPKK